MAVFEALADPTRRRILELLAGGERSAGDLAGEFAISRPGVSRHLRVLRAAGLVRARGDGQRRLYSVDPAPLAEVEQWLARYRLFWAQRLDALDTELRRARRAAGTDPAGLDGSGADRSGAGTAPATDERETG
ncbi:MAG TPA: metalloregulator ArsR/SmtB family transcription factor [Mycobacteriales bacterium]|nr:metalloregulator ArsR/SmtB family transcription factor [Mycobacteriales bacterium]